MIRFRCGNCGCKIAAQDKLAGKRARGPKCGRAVSIAPVQPKVPVTSQSNVADIKTAAENSAQELSFVDIPGKYETSLQPVSPNFVSSGASEDVQEPEPESLADQTEPTGERKLPWPIDIFLYPASTPGLLILAIIILIPLLIDVAAHLLGLFGFFIAVPGFVVKIVIALYMYWYFCECIRDSADGGVRAPDVLVHSPSLTDMLLQTLKIVGCLLVFAGPPGLYFRYTNRTDLILYGLLVYAVFLFPMGLLAVIMFDSFSGLNPVLLVGSILSTFFQYCGLIVFCCVLGVLFVKIASLLPHSRILAYAPATVLLYLLMVAAHLLGRFYWKYQEKLRWDV